VHRVAHIANSAIQVMLDVEDLSAANPAA